MPLGRDTATNKGDCPNTSLPGTIEAYNYGVNRCYFVALDILCVPPHSHRAGRLGGGVKQALMI